MQGTDNKPDPRLENARLNLRMALIIRDADATNTAKAAGLSQNALGSFLRGQSTISYLNMLKVCEVLNIPIGIMHETEGITPARIRLHRLLDSMQDHQLQATLELARKPDDQEFQSRFDRKKPQVRRP